MASGRAHKLSALDVKRASKPGKYGDGNCLYLVVTESGAKHWLLRLVIRGKRRDMGLGSADLVSLEEARDLARQYRISARLGGDPISERKASAGKHFSFKEAAIKVYELNVGSWKNEKHAKQWLTSLENHAFPILGHMSVSDISSADILRVLSPIWVDKTDTAKKIRQRLRMVFKWSKAQGYCSGDDPVELAEQALPRIKASGNHFKSARFEDLPDIITTLQASAVSLSTRLALEFLILTACRTTEVLEAHWGEIDLNKGLWVIPAERMKASKAHEVPLTPRMIAILEEAAQLKRDNGLLFPSPLSEKPLSNNTLRLALQKRLGIDATPHGMRSAFKDWVSETTAYPNEVSEMALGHVISNKVEAAYRRGNLIEKRRQMMAEWDAYLQGQDRKVIPIYQNKESI